jgi:iron complex transport system substrate-binding protein
LAGPRIVSLLPSATEIVAALGMRPNLVGRSHECDYPEDVQRVPAMTRARVDPFKPSRRIHRDVQEMIRKALSVFEVDVERLKAAKPDIILTQNQCAACAVHEDQLADAVNTWTGAKPQILSLSPATLSDVWADFGRVGDILDIGWAGRELTNRAKERVEILGERMPEIDVRRRIACVEWFDPPMLAGNWIPELLTAMGAEPLGVTPGTHSEATKLKDIVALDPDGMIFMPCGFDLARTAEEATPFLARNTVARMRSVRAKEIWLADGNAYFNRPGPRLITSLEILAEMLHPSAFNFGHEGTAWSKLV